MLEAIIFFLLWPLSFGQHLTDEAIYTINGKKTLHTVSEKFLSISIDPAVLLTGLNLSETTLQLGRHLSPAYIRIAGPSTQFVKYQDDSENGMLVVTPAMWFGINEWLASANLTPVFGINDRDIGREGWNPQDTMGLLEISDKFNVSCYWQLGYDCSNKTEEQYKNDLKRLQHILDAFPDQRNRWRIVGSDPRLCVKEPRRVPDEMANVLVAVVQEMNQKNEKPLLDPFLKPKIPIWVTSPKSRHSSTFACAITWAKELGEAAKNGYEVILKQPRLHEIFSETPPFWVSVLHKMLMGRHVLEVKTALLHPDLSVYAHCTKNQNDYIRSGAMTVFAVNNCTSNHTILIKFGTVFFKNTEVQSYMLTAQSEEAADIFLNGEKLSLGKFSGNKLNVLPKLRRTRIMNYLSLFLPPKSIGFFVLPGAQLTVCSSEETDMEQIIEEIKQDQNIQFSDDEVRFDVTPRFSPHKTPSLREMQRLMEEELESDERYYRPKKSRGDSLLKKVRDGEKEHKHKQEEKKIFELELTSAEIRKVLSDRAKAKAARKNIIFTSEELEEIMDKATQKFLNNKNASIRIRKKSKRETFRDKKDINMRMLKLRTLGDRGKILRASLRDSVKEALKNQKLKTSKREKRDINMELLKIKTEMLQNNKNRKPKKKFENKEEKKATIREPGQTSDEFLDFEDEEEGKDSPLPDGDVYAEIADPDELLFTTTTEKSKFLKPKNLFNFHKPTHKNEIRPTLPKIEFKPLQYEPEEREVFVNDFELEFSPEIGDDNFDCIHEFFGKSSGSKMQNNQNVSELWEIGLKPIEEKTDNHLPLLKSRVNNPLEDLEESAEMKDNEDNTFIENDYEDLEIDESGPLRLKRETEEYDLTNQQFQMLKDRLVYRKKMNFINKNNRYKSLTEGLKTWKPSDILSLKSPKSKRSVDHDVDSVENEIEDFLKNAELIKPKLDTEHGDYQLVFPNKDKIEVAENHDNTQVKFVLHEETPCATCPSTTEEATTKTNIQKISKMDLGNVWNKLLRKLTKFFQGLSARLKKCVVEDLIK